MSRSLTALAAASAAFFLLIGPADAQAQTPETDPQLAADVSPQSGGPHRDPPGVATLKPRCPEGWKAVPPGVNPALRCLPDDLVAALPRRLAAPSRGCPKGWNPVSPAINPVLRCQPGQISARQPPQAGPQRPIGCPDGWRAVPAGVNRLLRCLPDKIAAMSPPRAGQTAPPRGCPEGWIPVSPGINPLMRCLPGQVATLAGAGAQVAESPQRVGPHPGEPAQAAGVVGGPDLALIGAFKIGNQTLGWGTTATLPAGKAAFKKAGRCGFRYKYSTRNQGGLQAGGTSNRILLDAQNGAVLATAALPALAPGAAASSSGHVLLAPGTWTLYVYADAPLAVIESNEANNLRRVRVTVKGDC